jgi:hypothetical protein
MQIAFYKGKGDWKDSLIRYTTNSKYSHCELIFNSKQPEQWYSSSPRDNGTRFKEMPKTTNWDYLSIDCNEQPIYQWCQTQQNMRYDWLGILSICLPIDLQNPNRWFCSEICVAALQQQEILTQYKPQYISPGELYKLLEQLT